MFKIPSDISFTTKANGENTDDNNFVTTNTNSFITSNSKQSSIRLWRSRLSNATVNEDYIIQLGRKIELKYKLQIDNNKILNSFLSSTKILSIDEITEPSTKVSSIDELHNSNTKKNEYNDKSRHEYPPNSRDTK